MDNQEERKALIPYQSNQSVTVEEDRFLDAQIRNSDEDAQNILEHYRDGLSVETKRRHKHDIIVFCLFLQDKKYILLKDRKEVETYAKLLSETLQAWVPLSIDTSLVRDYVSWMKDAEYATGSINTRLATIKAYCQRLADAHLLSENEYTSIKRVEGAPEKKADNINASRQQKGIATRKANARKEKWIELSPEQVKKLLQAVGTSTPIARRDNLLIRLSWLHALRVGEIVKLKVASINLETGIIEFDRPKVHLKNQRIELLDKSLEVARTYIQDRLAETTLGTNAPLFASYKAKNSESHAHERPILPVIASRRVAYLVKKHLGIEHASMHDGRHYYATDAFRKGNTLKDVMEGGGWKTPYIPLQYAARLQVANKNVKLTSVETEEQEQ